MRILNKNKRLLTTITFIKNNYSTAPKSLATLRIKEKEYRTDDYTNITPKILSYLNQNLHLKKDNPLSLVRQRIVNYFYSSFTHRGNPTFSVYDNMSPIVSTKQNFDDLLIPEDHPSRAKSDCYYINSSTLLRAHMTAHQSELLRAGLDNFLMIGDVYRRDEIDSTHFPVFHQVSDCVEYFYISVVCMINIRMEIHYVYNHCSLVTRWPSGYSIGCCACGHGFDLCS